MKYRIIVNECGVYRVEKLVVPEDDPADAQWTLQMELSELDGVIVGPREFDSWQHAMDWIGEQIEAPEWERKRNTWSVVEEVPKCDG